MTIGRVVRLLRVRPLTQSAYADDTHPAREGFVQWPTVADVYSLETCSCTEGGDGLIHSTGAARSSDIYNLSGSNIIKI